LTFSRDGFGRFFYLLRAGTDSGTVWEVQFRFDYGFAAPLGQYATAGPIKSVSTGNNTIFDLYEMGTANVPIRNLHALPLSSIPDDRDQNFTILIDARRTFGSGNLYLDAILPVPNDEGFAHPDFPGNSAVDQNQSLFFGQSPEGIWDGVGVNAVPLIFSKLGVGSPVQNGLTLPPGDGRMVVVFASITEQDPPSTSYKLNPSDSGKYYERWYTLRGNE